MVGIGDSKWKSSSSRRRRRHPSGQLVFRVDGAVRRSFATLSCAQPSGCCCIESRFAFGALATGERAGKGRVFWFANHLGATALHVTHVVVKVVEIVDGAGEILRRKSRDEFRLKHSHRSTSFGSSATSTAGSTLTTSSSSGSAPRSIGRHVGLQQWRGPRLRCYWARMKQQEKEKEPDAPQ